MSEERDRDVAYRRTHDRLVEFTATPACCLAGSRWAYGAWASMVEVQRVASACLLSSELQLPLPSIATVAAAAVTAGLRID